MSRKGQNMASGTYNTAGSVGGDARSKADAAYSQLMPLYSSEAHNPTGFDPTTLAEMRTGSEESTGGAAAGAKGEMGLSAARNRNSGSTGAVVDQSARDASEVNSKNNLGIDNENALMKETQRQSGIQGMNNLWQGDTNELMSSLGVQNGATNAYTNAGNSGWFQNMTGLLNAISGAGMKTAGGGGFSL